MILTLLAAMFLTFAAADFWSARSASQQIGASRSALVTVADGRNRPIVDLGPDDFVISEAGQAREILNVRPADYSIVILVDSGSAAAADFEDIRRAVVRFIGRLGQRPVAIGTLGDPPAMLTPIDGDREQVLKQLETLSSSPSAESVTLESVTMAASTLGLNGQSFAAIVVVSATPVDATRRRPEEMIGPIVDSGAIVHVIANRSRSVGPDADRDTRSVVTSGSVGRPDQMLHTVTDQTRGLFTPIYSAASYASALDRLSDRLSAELLIEYLVPRVSKANDVKIGVRIPGARTHGLGVRPRD